MIALKILRALVISIIAAPLVAQSYQAEVRGLVTDPSHAVVSGAKVTLTDETKHVARVTVTDSAGQ